MIEIDTAAWPMGLWFKTVHWCMSTWGLKSFGTKWSFDENYGLAVDEKYLPLLILWISDNV